MKDNNLILLEEEEQDTRNLSAQGELRSHQKGNKLEERLKMNLFNVFCSLIKGLQLTPWKFYVIISIEFVQFLQFSFHPSPILEILFMMLTCENMSPVDLLKEYPNLEIDIKGANVLVMIHSRVDFFLILLKLFLVIVFQFLQDDSFDGFKILILVVFSTMTFSKYLIHRPYYNRKLNNTLTVLYGIYAWTNCLLLLGAILGTARFNMLLIIYLLGIPIIVSLILTLRDDEMKILLTPLYKFQKAEEALYQFNQLIFLIETKDNKRESAILIKGFVSYHEMTCIDEDCALKQYRRNLMKQSAIGGRSNQSGQQLQLADAQNKSGIGMNSTASQKLLFNESNSLLLNFTKKLLEKSIRRFPQFTLLKITYSHFLLDHMGNKREAMRELNECSKLKPSLDQQFIIFRYKKLIGDSLIESGKESGGFEYVSAVNFESNYRKCKLNIERTSLLHYEFWNHLLEDSPDLGRLSDLGYRIDQQMKQVEYHWNQMQMIFPNTPRALKLYAQFQIEVLNDKEGGNELLTKAKETSQIKANFDMGGNVDELAAGGLGLNQQDGSPLVYISGENDRMGLISSLNLSACRVFGYLRKEELINKNVKVLQPVIYSTFHDEFLRCALLKTQEQMTNKERSIFGRHVSGYIFPLSIQIKFFQSFLHGKQFVATLKSEKKGINNSVAYAIIDKQGIIQDLSSSNIIVSLQFLGAITLLDIDKQKIAKKRIQYDLSVLVPQLFSENQQKYFGKQGERVTYYYPEIVDNIAENKKNSPHQDQGINEENKSDHSMTSIDDIDDANRSNVNFNDKEESDPERTRNSAVDLYEDNNFDLMVKANEEKKQLFHCNMMPIQFQSINNGETQAYSVRLELIQEEQKLEEGGENVVKVGKKQKERISKIVKMSDFQFSFSPIYKKFVRELRDEENKEVLNDNYYSFVKKENLKRSEEQPKLTVMSHLTQQKLRMEKQEENSKAALMGENYIQEEDQEYSDESDQDDMQYHRKKNERSQAKSKESSENLKGKPVEQTQKEIDEQARNVQRRINQLINNKYSHGSETPEKLIEKIQEITEILKQKSKVGEDIKTYRIFLGEISLVEEVTGQFLINKSSESTQVESEETTDEDKKDSDKVDDVFKNSLKSRKAFQSQLNDRSVPPPVKNLQYTANVILLIFICLSIIDYSMVRSDFTTIGLNYEVVQKTFQLVSEMQKSVYHTRSLVFYSKNQLSMTDLQISLAKSDMKKSLNSIYILQSEINLQSLSVSQAHSDILDSKNVQMYFKQQDNLTDIKALNFSLTEGLLQLSSSLFTLTNLDNKTFDDTQDDVFYFMYNNFMDTLIAMWKSSYMYVDELQDRTGEINEANVIVFYCSIGGIIASVVLLIPVVQIVNRTKQKYLELFLEMDNNNIRKLANKCEKYMNMLQDEGNEEIDSNDEELEEMARMDTEDEYSFSKRSKKKRAKNTIKSKRMFIVKFIIGMFIIEIYFLALFLLQKDFLKKYHVLGKEMNMTTSIEPYFWFSINAQRELYNNKNRPVLKLNSFDISKEAISNVQDMNSEMQQDHLQNEEYATNSYNTKFKQVMLENICESVNTHMSTEESQSFQTYTNYTCEKYISGSTTQGLHTVIVRYEEGLRKVLSNYQKGNKTTSAIKSLLNSQDITELFFIQRFIISSNMNSIIQQLQDSVQTEVNSQLEARLAIFCLFIILLLLLFVTVWLPFINGLSNEVHQTKKILLVIPLELLINMKNIANLLNHKQSNKDKQKV